MSRLLIENANLILPNRILANHSVLCDKGRIVQIGPAEDFPQDTAATVIDASGEYLAPGYKNGKYKPGKCAGTQKKGANQEGI